MICLSTHLPFESIFDCLLAETMKAAGSQHKRTIGASRVRVRCVTLRVTIALSTPPAKLSREDKPCPRIRSTTTIRWINSLEGLQFTPLSIDKGTSNDKRIGTLTKEGAPGPVIVPYE